MPYLNRLAACLALVCISISSVQAQENNQPPAGFTALFNGRDFKDWTGGATRDPREMAAMNPTERAEHDAKMRRGIDEHWRVEFGELVSDGREPYLATKTEYGDFELWVDWMIHPQGDSGIYLRGVPQVQIWDPTDVAAHRNGSDKGSGALWNNQKHERWPKELADEPPGHWNRMFIRMVGPYVSVDLNGKRVVNNVLMENYYDRSIPVFMRGPIYLQTHGAETRFRNVFLREIPYEESVESLVAIRGGEAGFEPLFNGRNFDGWMGALDSYEVVDGAIRCQAGRGGNLLTNDEFGNFVVRLEFKLPPGGNNGLAIRAPAGVGDAAYSALELQVLDNSAGQYATLHDYQYHGSAYGLAPATRGYLRPVGDWNFQEVVVDGDRVEVHLNGFEILNVNLAEARKKPLDGREHPGASRTSGHFGFCGHNDPVEFRNIRIKRL
jgi:hypothetical protein